MIISVNFQVTSGEGGGVAFYDSISNQGYNYDSLAQMYENTSLVSGAFNLWDTCVNLGLQKYGLDANGKVLTLDTDELTLVME